MMLDSESFSEKLIKWYHVHKRDLPWRNTKNPYLIWISEIVLQQTRVDQGLSYYQKIAKAFPHVLSLAEADEQEVLKLWQGLGYYSRARNLHATAKIIRDQHQGEFPSDHASILALKGIGPYTAAAIASFAFDLPHPVIDGNVMRVISRYFGIREPIDQTETLKLLKNKIDVLFDAEHPADFNQAIMEFGALHCLPANPKCVDCIFNQSCIAYQKDQVHEIPFKAVKIKKKKRYINYLVIQQEDQLVLQKRTEKGIWQNLYDFPSIEQENKQIGLMEVEQKIQAVLKNNAPHFIQKTSWKKHLLTHQEIHFRFWEYNMPETFKMENSAWQMLAKSSIHNYPVPKLIEQYLQAF